jgi:hypothetical protein
MSKMKKYQGFKASLGLCAILSAMGLASAQDMDVQGDASNAGIVLQGKNINPTNADNIGVRGYSIPAGNWGYGVMGEGGFRGVEGRANATGNSGVRTGVYGSASNGAANYGMQGFSQGITGTNTGVHGNASGTGSRGVSGIGAGTNSVGVYGSASGTGSRAGYFAGSLQYTGSLIGPSDRKLKKNIVELRNCLFLINKLGPKEYDYRTDEFPNMNLPKTPQVGLVAQEVEAVFPQLVEETSLPVVADGNGKGSPADAKTEEKYKGVNYMGLIPILIGAIKEQQNQINDLTAQVAKLKK